MQLTVEDIKNDLRGRIDGLTEVIENRENVYSLDTKRSKIRLQAFKDVLEEIERKEKL